MARITLDLMINLFDGNGFIHSVLTKNPKVKYFNEDQLDEVYYLSKIALLKIMRLGKKFDTEGDMYGYIFGVVYNCYRTSVANMNAKKNSIEYEYYDNKDFFHIESSPVHYDDLPVYLDIVKRALDMSKEKRFRMLSSDDIVSIFVFNVIEGYTPKELAQKYNVSTTAIQNAMRVFRNTFKRVVVAANQKRE